MREARLEVGKLIFWHYSMCWSLLSFCTRMKQSPLQCVLKSRLCQNVSLQIKTCAFGKVHTMYFLAPRALCCRKASFQSLPSLPQSAGCPLRLFWARGLNPFLTCSCRSRRIIVSDCLRKLASPNQMGWSFDTVDFGRKASTSPSPTSVLALLVSAICLFLKEQLWAEALQWGFKANTPFR